MRDFILEKVDLAGRITLFSGVPCGVSAVLASRGTTPLEAAGWGTAAAMAILWVTTFVQAYRSVRETLNTVREEELRYRRGVVPKREEEEKREERDERDET